MNQRERSARLKKLASDKAKHGQEVNRLFRLGKHNEAEALIRAKADGFHKEEDELRKPGKAGGRYKSIAELESCAAVITYYDMLLAAYKGKGQKRMKEKAANQIFDDLNEGNLGPNECLRKINHWKTQLDELEDQYAIDAVNAMKQRIWLTGQVYPTQRLSDKQATLAKAIATPSNTPKVTEIPLTPDMVREFVREAHKQLGLQIV
jgi:hypothetical protein